MKFKYLPPELLPENAGFQLTLVPGSPRRLGPKDIGKIPDKIRPMRKFAQLLGIKRPYLHRKPELKSIIIGVLNEAR